MADGLSWGEPRPLLESAPRSPYAHWQITQGGSDASAGLVALTGSAAALRTEWVATGATPLGSQSEIPEDERLTPVGDLNPAALNRGSPPIDTSTVSTSEDAEDIDAIVGIIDDGIAFAHERFRCAYGSTRFDWLWLQGVPYRGLGSRGPLFGTEFGRQELNSLMTEFALPSGDLDEEGLYSHVGLTDTTRCDAMSVAMAASHGTAVLDQAAGFPPSDRPNRLAIIGVNLPEEVTQDTSGSMLDVFLVGGIERILQRACAIQAAREGSGKGPVPVLINVSMSLTAGPKNGTSFFGRYVAAKVGASPSGPNQGHVEIYLPIGNHRLTQAHASVCTENPVLTWRILPDDRTPSFMEIWLDDETGRPDRPTVCLEVCPPGSAGFSTVPAAAAPAFGTYLDLGPADAPQARAYYTWHPKDLQNPEGAGQQRIVLAVPPSEPDGSGQNAAPAGDWAVRLVRNGGGTVAAEAFVQRDDTLTGARRRGRQSFFVGDRYRVYDDRGRQILTDVGQAGPIMRSGTLNALASDLGARTVTGYRRSDETEVWYAGLGNRHKEKADFITVCEDGVAHPGILTAGSRSGSRVAVGGTSMAAPRALRKRLERILGIGPPPPEKHIAEIIVGEPYPGPYRRTTIDPPRDQDGNAS